MMVKTDVCAICGRAMTRKQQEISYWTCSRRCKEKAEEELTKFVESLWLQNRGQDRKSYSDIQDRKSYVRDEE